MNAVAELQVERREAIRRLIRAQRVATQEELRERLAGQGFDVTQATLSRDLARIGARRVTLPEGGSTYELEGLGPAPSLDHPLAQLRPMVVDMDFNDSMVVVHTIPGAASPVALAMDRARLEEVLGTIAGDDTVFVAPRRGHPAGKVCKQLRSLMKAE
ncbi:MAG TPA: arginine repressor [Myxococcaceae bacterium]|jgi:transcriptional regulator of arginine metabolism